MFLSATAFNGDISGWDMRSVQNMFGMFYAATQFNGDISSWNVSNCVIMRRMFDRASSFNQDLSSWDVTKVADMESMFSSATAFNQDLCAWGDRILTSDDSTIRPKVTNMFLSSACPSTSDPAFGFPVSPLCHICS